MRLILLAAVVSIGLLVCSTSARAQEEGKLSAVREALTTPKPKKTKKKSTRHHDDHDRHKQSSSSWGIFFSSNGDCSSNGYPFDDDYGCCDDDDDDDDVSLSSFLGTVFLGAVTSPFWLPRSALDDVSRTESNFASYPYWHDHDGYLMFDTLEEDADRYDPFAFRFYSEYGSDFHGLDRYGGRLLLDSSSGLGIDTEWNRWTEDLGSVTDELWTGDINVIYRFAESEHAQFRAGLGWNWLQDRVVGHQNGFNFTYGFDLFPAKPFVIQTTFDLGRIDSSTLIHARSTAGVVWEHVELFAGYDFRKLGGVNLSGFVTGMTLWW